MGRKGLKGGHAAVHHPHSHRSSAFGCGDSGQYDEPAHTGPKGLKNIGNSCYANATLQCLLNTALPHALTDPKASAIFRRYSSNPNILAQGSGSVDSEEDCCTTTTEVSSVSGNTSHRLRRRQILERKRMEHERLLENCNWLTSELRQITLDYLKPDAPRSNRSWMFTSEPAVVVDPGSITRQPDRLSKSLVPYSQEDAHEFMRALLTNLTMQGQNKELSSLFDGLLESSVTCQSCFRPSLTRDRYMDLSLDICGNHINTLSDALEDFCKSETLSGDNAVYCRHCKHKRTATKGLRLATAPSILVCHFKRFAYNPYGRMVRLKKHVQFPETLHIGDFMSKVNQARPPPYELVAVLVHQGNSCDSGHYLAYVKNSGLWYRCNDSLVEEVDFQTVLNQQAYICMYEVADMRVNHGYCDIKETMPVATERKQDYACFGLPSMLLCGAEYGPVFSDFCQWAEPPKVKKKKYKARSARSRLNTTQNSRDDLSTLGESTVESSDTSRRRFQRSISSGNLRRQDSSYSPPHRRSSSTTVKLHERQSARNRAPQRSRRNASDLPPRPVR